MKLSGRVETLSYVEPYVCDCFEGVHCVLFCFVLFLFSRLLDGMDARTAQVPRDRYFATSTVLYCSPPLFLAVAPKVSSGDRQLGAAHKSSDHRPLPLSLWDRGGVCGGFRENSVWYFLALAWWVCWGRGRGGGEKVGTEKP